MIGMSDQGDIYFTSINRFFECVQTPQQKRVNGLIYDLKLDFESAMYELNLKFNAMLPDQKELYSNRILKVMEKIFLELDSSAIEYKYLNEFRNRLLSFVVFGELYFEKLDTIFKKGERLKIFFLRTLFSLGAIDQEYNCNKKFPAYVKAVFECEYYREKVFREGLTLKDYFNAVNDFFGTNLNSRSHSSGKAHIDKVMEFFEKEFDKR